MGAKQSQTGSKGNGASKRMGNAVRKIRRERCWENGQKRKEARRRVQQDACKRNAVRATMGGLSPWQEAKAARRAKRAARKAA